MSQWKHPLLQRTEWTRGSQRRIHITKRWSDYHACLYGRPEIWGAGETPHAAVGALVTAHPEHFGLTQTFWDYQPKL